MAEGRAVQFAQMADGPAVEVVRSEDHECLLLGLPAGGVSIPGRLTHGTIDTLRNVPLGGAALCGHSVAGFPAVESRPGPEVRECTGQVSPSPVAAHHGVQAVAHTVHRLEVLPVEAQPAQIQNRVVEHYAGDAHGPGLARGGRPLVEAQREPRCPGPSAEEQERREKGVGGQHSELLEDHRPAHGKHVPLGDEAPHLRRPGALVVVRPPPPASLPFFLAALVLVPARPVVGEDCHGGAVVDLGLHRVWRAEERLAHDEGLVLPSPPTVECEALGLVARPHEVGKHDLVRAPVAHHDPGIWQAQDGFGPVQARVFRKKSQHLGSRRHVPEALP